jgi:hypothetical protein
MWDRIHFTPEEERALKEAEREIARRRWEELGILRPEGGVPPKKKPRRTTPKTPRRCREPPDPDDWSRRLHQAAEALRAAESFEATQEALTRLSAIMREGTRFFEEP